MWCARRSRAWLALQVLALVACAIVLALEASREPSPGAWRSATAGLGAGSRAGLGAGFFAFDPRLESAPCAALGPLPGNPFNDGAGPAGVLAPARPIRTASEDR